jgi:hypothetical protein
MNIDMDKYMDMDKSMDMDTDTETDMDKDIYFYWTGELGRLYTLISYSKMQQFASATSLIALRAKLILHRYISTC